MTHDNCQVTVCVAAIGPLRIVCDKLLLLDVKKNKRVM